MPKTMTDQVIDFLLSRGCKEVESKSSKYRTFSRPDDDKFYFVGHQGAVRAGKVSTKSVSVTDTVHIRALEWERDQLRAELAAAKTS